MQIETDRLILRPFVDSDAAAVSRNSMQPTAARFLPDMVLETEEEALGWIRWINEEKNDNTIPFAAFAVVHKASEKCIGMIGVAPKWEIGNEIEIVFLIADDHRNNGYATEAGRAMIRWTFEKTDQKTLSAIVKPENKASGRVIEKLGFCRVDTRTLEYDGADCEFDYFRLDGVDMS